MVDSPAHQPEGQWPPVLPQRGLSGFVLAIAAGLSAAGLGWVSLVYGMNYPFLLVAVALIPVPLFMVGLGVGRSDAIVATMVALGSMALLINVPLMAIVGVLFVIPTLMLSALALRHRRDAAGVLYWYPTGRLLTALVLYPLFIFSAFAFFVRETGMQKMLVDFLTPAINTLMNSPEALQSMPTPPTPELVERAVTMTTALMPGMMILSWCCTLLVAALWTQFTLMTNKMALRPLPQLTDFDLPAWLVVLYAIMVLLAVAFEGEIAYFARNTLLPLSLPYFFVGTSLVHLWASRRKNKMMVLFLFYFFVIGIVWPVVLVALAGVLEPWLHLRQRILGKTKPVS